eukprot:2476-Heterococcus_DN1.PRE.1
MSSCSEAHSAWYCQCKHGMRAKCNVGHIHAGAVAALVEAMLSAALCHSCTAAQSVDRLLQQAVLAACSSICNKVMLCASAKGRWVQQGSALHDDAARRQTTLYIPEGHVTMFPADLAEQDMLRLTAYTIAYTACAIACCACAIIIVFESKCRKRNSPSTEYGRYTNRNRLTYDHVDEMLYDGMAAEGGEEWELGRLAHYARLRFRYRCANGSVDRFKRAPQNTIKVKEQQGCEDDLTIAITLDDPDRASTQLVTELMIMSGEGMAKLVVVELLLPVYDTTTTHATHTTVTQSKLHCEQQQAKSK